MYRTRVFLSHGQFSLFQIVLLFSYHLAVSQRRGNLKLNAAPSYWPPAPLMINWPNLMPGGDDCYVQKKEMFGFHDKAAFYKHIGDPKMNSCWPFPSLLYVLSLAKPFKCPISSPSAPLVPFLHLWLPDSNRVKRQPTSHMISRTDSYLKKKNLLWI